MSFTSKLKSNDPSSKEFKSIIEYLTPKKEDFGTYTEEKAFSKSYHVFAPYILNDPIEARLVGTAFDYLARIIISRYTKSKVDIKQMPCVSAFNHIQNSSIQDRFYRHTHAVEKYISGHNNSFEIIGSVVFFAHLEYIGRSGNFNQKLFDTLYTLPSKEVLKDLKTQGDIFFKVFIQSGLIQPSSQIVFAPNFGTELTNALGGIDADIFIDSVLYDFKATKSYAYNKGHALQITGYYLFHLLDKLLYDGSELKDHQISKIALYKSRFGQIEYFDLKKLKHKDITDVLIKLVLHLNLKINTIRIKDLTHAMAESQLIQRP